MSHRRGRRDRNGHCQSRFRCVWQRALEGRLTAASNLQSDPRRDKQRCERGEVFPARHSPPAGRRPPARPPLPCGYWTRSSRPMQAADPCKLCGRSTSGVLEVHRRWMASRQYTGTGGGRCRRAAALVNGSGWSQRAQPAQAAPAPQGVRHCCATAPRPGQAAAAPTWRGLGSGATQQSPAAPAAAASGSAGAGGRCAGWGQSVRRCGGGQRPRLQAGVPAHSQLRRRMPAGAIPHRLSLPSLHPWQLAALPPPHTCMPVPAPCAGRRQSAQTTRGPGAPAGAAIPWPPAPAAPAACPAQAPPVSPFAGPAEVGRGQRGRRRGGAARGEGEGGERG